MKRCLIVAISFFALGLVAHAEDLAIVVEKNVPLDSVSSADLAKLFRCEKTSASGGIAISIVTRERGSAERNAVLANIYKFTDQAYEKYFMQQMFTGAISAAPKLVPSALIMKKLVVASPGTVGYMKAGDVDDSVKVLKIDGSLPGEPNYPIKLAN
jgi:hypothetical protein